MNNKLRASRTSLTFKVFMYMQLQDLAHELEMGLESLQKILMEESKRSQKEQQNLQCLQV